MKYQIYNESDNKVLYYKNNISDLNWYYHDSLSNTFEAIYDFKLKFLRKLLKLLKIRHPNLKLSHLRIKPC